MKKIRVLHCLSSIAGGGVERRRLLLAQQLDPRRYEQRILARAVKGEIVQALNDAGMPVTTVGQGRLFDPRALWRATRIALDWQPDIVHGAVFEGLSLAVVAGRLSRARVVIEETSHAVNRSRRGHALFRTLIAASDACVAISPAVADFLVDVTGVPRQKITVISNGAAAPALPTPEGARAIRAELGIAPTAFVVGTVARLTDDTHKRVSDLIRATALLAPASAELRLLVVGDGAERPPLARLAESLGVQDRVIFAGHRADVGAMYAIMDAFALVSAREGFGLVLAEAMLCGLPVIGTAVGGIPNIVDDRRTGILIPPREPVVLSQAIEELRRDPELRRALGDAGRDRARAHFSAERYVADVDAFYQRLMS
jgi:glycosyltransferase involved in cell wall biosynthesis